MVCCSKKVYWGSSKGRRGLLNTSVGKPAKRLFTTKEKSVIIVENMNLITSLHRDYPLYLDDESVSGLVTWEDWISTYLQLNEATNSTSWLKADFLVKLFDKFGGESLEKFASDVGEPRSTVTNYVRVSRAFPPENRVPHMSFTHHYQASFVDSYDESKKEFTTDKRFGIMEEAGTRNISTRQLKDEIQEIKEKEYNPLTKDICNFCKKETSEYQRYVFFSPGAGKEADKFKFHEKCYKKILEYIENYA